MNKKTLIIAVIIGGIIWQVGHYCGSRTASQEVGDELLAACELAIDHTQTTERKIARWSAQGCHDTTDCGEMERAWLVGWQYRPMGGTWLEVE